MTSVNILEPKSLILAIFFDLPITPQRKAEFRKIFVMNSTPQIITLVSYKTLLRLPLLIRVELHEKIMHAETAALLSSHFLPPPTEFHHGAHPLLQPMIMLTSLYYLSFAIQDVVSNSRHKLQIAHFCDDAAPYDNISMVRSILHRNINFRNINEGRGPQQDHN